MVRGCPGLLIFHIPRKLEWSYPLEKNQTTPYERYQAVLESSSVGELLWTLHSLLSASVLTMFLLLTAAGSGSPRSYGPYYYRESHADSPLSE